MPTIEEIQECFKTVTVWFSKNKQMFDKDMEHDAVELIKCKGDHIGTYEARTILAISRLFFLNE